MHKVTVPACGAMLWGCISQEHSRRRHYAGYQVGHMLKAARRARFGAQSRHKSTSHFLTQATYAQAPTLIHACTGLSIAWSILQCFSPNMNSVLCRCAWTCAVTYAPEHPVRASEQQSVRIGILRLTNPCNCPPNTIAQLGQLLLRSYSVGNSSG